jgi:hypothetical protein
LSKLGALATAFGLNTKDSSETKDDTSTRSSAEDTSDDNHHRNPIHGQFGMGMMSSFKLQNQKYEYGVEFSSPEMVRHTEDKDKA